jgi:F0F1-type ATP synthase assembly protein I
VKERFTSRLSKAQGAAYQAAMEAVLAVPIAVGFGYWADEYFETSPRYLLVGAVIGFCAMVLRLARMRPGADESSADAEDAEDAEDERAAGTVDDGAADEGGANAAGRTRADPANATQNGKTSDTREA